MAAREPPAGRNALLTFSAVVIRRICSLERWTDLALPSRRRSWGIAMAREHELPHWDRESGIFYWHGKVLFHVAAQAFCMRAILDAFESHDWVSIVDDPLPVPGCRDTAKRRRKAVQQLNDHQPGKPAIQFLSVGKGRQIAWLPMP